jgi:acyl transferase domain-containing protein/NADPH:quinone reductase-like Zn-dependent oxidoreductase
VKSNIGHTQAAAGVAGVIKMVAALQHAVVPATLHVDAPSSHVDWSAGAVELVTEAVPWPDTGRPRRAGVSSFGISGTNAHVILEQAPPEQAGDPEEGPGPETGTGRLLAAPVVPWVLSAKTEAGLRTQAARLAGHVAADPGLDPVDAGWSLATTRSAFGYRAVVTGAGRDELLAGLAAVAAGEPAAGVVTGVAQNPGKTVLVFPGQGSQWPGMAAGLLRECPVFADRMRACADVLDPVTGWSLLDAVSGGDLERVEVVQPALWAVMVSLAAVWAAAGVVPDAVVGHSQGEIAAACVAGVLSLADGARVVALRSRALAGLAGSGGMVSVAAPEAEVAGWLGRWPGLSVAAVNGPSAVVVSGDNAALDGLAGFCEQRGVRARRVEVDYASHCGLVDPVAGEVAAALAGIRPGRGDVPVFSTVTGDWADGGAMDGGYWWRNLREPVRFADAVTALAGQGFGVFVEASPHPVLVTGVQESLEAAGALAAVTGTLRRGEGGMDRLADSLARVWTHGGAVDWAALLPGGQRAGLPTYAFQRQRYWLPSGPAPAGPGDPGDLGQAALGHPLLSAAVELPGSGGVVLTGRLSLTAQPWIAGHVVAGLVLLPGTAFVDVAARAGMHVGCPVVDELVIEAPLVVPGDGSVSNGAVSNGAVSNGAVSNGAVSNGAVPIRVVVTAAGAAGRRGFEVFSQGADDPAWTRHVTGTLAPAGSLDDDATVSFGAWPPAAAEPVDLASFYDGLAGVTYGPEFRGLTAAWRCGEEVFAEVALGEGVTAQPFVVHPVLLDAALQAIGLGPWAQPGGPLAAADGSPLMPFSWTGVRLHATGATTLRVRVTAAADGVVAMQAADAAGAPVASVSALVLRPLPVGRLAGAAAVRDALWRVDWQRAGDQGAGEQGAGPAEPGPQRWAVVGPDQGLDLPDAPAYPDLDTLSAALSATVGHAGPAPDVVVACCPRRPAAADVPGQTRSVTAWALNLVQQWLGDDRFAGSRLVVVTSGAALAGGPDSEGSTVGGVWGGRPPEGSTAGVDVAAAAVPGLVRSAASENPGRFILADVDRGPGSAGLIQAGVATAEPEFAVRAGAVWVPRLARAPRDGMLAVPEQPGGWRLEVTERGTASGVALVSSGEGSRPLGEQEVRVGVRAAGLNFRDVLNVLGMYPAASGDPGQPGSEAAGVVLETGAAVTGLAAGDRVMGLFGGGAFGPAAVTDRRLLAPVPRGWSFAAAATVPAAFVTAYYGLVDLAGLTAGESVLIHAAAGGVGMAAVQLARHLGAEVFATASPAKQPLLYAAGLDPAHVASSRSPDFAGAFAATTGGRGVDVVLDALKDEFVDASLRLLAPGGRFVEMGKTDVRDPGQVAAAHPGARYQAFDLAEAGPDRIAEILALLGPLFGDETLAPLPRRTWNVRRAPEALRFMSQARHAGKIVLTIPRPPEPGGTVLITGVSGGLAAVAARHLVTGYGVRHLLLASRRGPEAPGAGALVADLAGLGAQADVVACDVSDRSAVADLLAAVPAGHPLTGVVHTAGIVDDGLVTSLTPARVDGVLAAKAAGAWHLHELTEGQDLAMFVMYSSASGVLGNAGQGSYAAANAAVDALAARRQAAGLPAVSLAWGPWARETQMSAQLGRDTWRRIAAGGYATLPDHDALALFDAAGAAAEAVLVPLRFDPVRLAGQASAVPPFLTGVVRRAARPGHITAPAAGGDPAGSGGRGQDGPGLAARLNALTGGERDRALADLVRAYTAVTLGHSGPDAIDPGRAFSDIGFDSLTAVDLRNRLTAATGLRLPATLIFDHPSPAALAGYLTAQLWPELTPPSVEEELDRFDALLAAGTADEAQHARVAARLRALTARWSEPGPGVLAAEPRPDLASASAEEMFDILDNELEVP